MKDSEITSVAEAITDMRDITERLKSKGWTFHPKKEESPQEGPISDAAYKAFLGETLSDEDSEWKSTTAHDIPCPLPMSYFTKLGIRSAYKVMIQERLRRSGIQDSLKNLISRWFLEEDYTT